MRSRSAPSEVGRHHGSVEDLDTALSEHRALPFPSAVEKGRVYGQIEPVSIDGDIFGLAEAASIRGRADRRLDAEQVARLRKARADLTASLADLPAAAVGYFESVMRLADLALATAGERA